MASFPRFAASMPPARTARFDAGKQEKPRGFGRFCLGLILGLAVATLSTPAHAAAPTISVSDTSVTEGDASSIIAQFHINLSAASATPVTVKYATADFSALAGSDYTSKPLTTLTFAPGETSKNVAVKGDVIDEADEAFLVKLSEPTNATIADASGTGKIIDNDTSVVTAAGSSVTEGNEGTASMSVNLKLSTPNGRDVKVKVKTVNAATVPATAGADYVAMPSTLVTFAPGEIVKTLFVTINSDVLDEDNEKIGLELSTPVNATLGASSPGTIFDDDNPPTMSVDDVSVVEGNNDANASFHVALSAPSGRAITVKYNTEAATATVGTDYTELPLSTLTFAPGQTTKTVNVLVKGDKVDEADETFAFKLSAATNASIADSKGIGTIEDDDTSILSVAGNQLQEGDGELRLMKFTFKLSTPNSRDVKVKAQTVLSTINPATPGVDYTPIPLTILTFPAGETAQVVAVNILGDELDEVDERVAMQLTNPVNATLGSNLQGNILDDDALPSVSVGDALVTEQTSGSQTATVNVSLSTPSGRPVTVQYATADITATAGEDYVAAPLSTLTFAPGQTVKPVNLKVNGDSNEEGNEQFKVALSGNVNCTIVDDTGIVTITEGTNSAPTLEDDFYYPDYQHQADPYHDEFDVLENDSDPDGDTLSIVSISEVSYPNDTLKIAIVNNKIRVDIGQPSPESGGLDFTYTVTDGITTSTANIEIDITTFSDLFNFAPEGHDDVYNDPTAYNPGDTLVATVDVLANDTDQEGDPMNLTYVYIVGGDFSGEGTAEIVDNKVKITAPGLIRGGRSIQFVYGVSDGGGNEEGGAFGEIFFDTDGNPSFGSLSESGSSASSF